MIMLIPQPIGDGTADRRHEILPERVARVINIDRAVQIERDQEAENAHRDPVVDRLHQNRLRIAAMRMALRIREHIGRECVIIKAISPMDVAATMCIGVAVLGGCSKRAPTGQVITIANGEEITSGELEAEASLRGVANAGDAAVRASLLRDIVDRKLWAQAARHDRLDQQVQYVLARRRSEDALLADMQIRRVSDQVAPPSGAEVDAYLRANPATFANRTVFAIDQINLRSDGNAALENDLAGAKSLDEVNVVLARDGVVGQRSRSDWNSLFMPADLAAKLTRIPLQQIFIQRDGATLIAATVIAKTVQPLRDVDRRILARQSLTQRKVQAAVASRLTALHASANITLQRGYTLAEANKL